jgi:hypothetical protein
MAGEDVMRADSVNKLLEFHVAGGTVVVESSEAVGGSVVRGSGLGKLTERVGMSLGDTLAVVRPLADATLAACGELASRPDVVEVEFGLKFDAAVGAFVAESRAGASLNIKLSWKPQ